MQEDGIRLLDLMFREGETICVHHNKYGYYSIPKLHAFDDKVTMVPTLESVQKQNEQRRFRGEPEKTFEESIEQVPSDDMIFVALNPIKGYRNDANCYKYRNFLVEMDAGPLDHQMKYIKTAGMPYSAAIFSGGKSLHFLISVDTDLPNEEMYRFFAEWILKALPLADPNTKNPSRSIRVPGAYRPGGKLQELYDWKGTVKMADLVEWLKRYPDARPQPASKRGIHDSPQPHNVSAWVNRALTEGLDPTKPRNTSWFAIAYEFALNGYDEHDTIEILGISFVPERDFSTREWKSAIKSAFKHCYANKDSGK